MKKLLLSVLLCSSIFALAQVHVTPKSEDFNEIYTGGSTQLVKDLQVDFGSFSSSFQVNGTFVLTFDLDEHSQILNAKVSPDVDQDFSRELIRTFKRVKKNFKTETSIKNIAIELDFNTDFKETDGRSRFTEVPPRSR